MENLIEELTKVNPANLSEEGLKLFNKIMEIIDRNEELEEINKIYKNTLKSNEINLDKKYVNYNYIPKSKVREKIEEAKEYEKNVKTIITVNGTYYIPSSAYYKILQKGYSELLQEGDK